VVGPVVHENETRRGVVKVRSTDESIVDVIEVRLDFGAWQAALDEKPSKAGLHWRFGGCRKHRKGTQPSRTGAAGCGVGVPTKRRRIRQAPMQRHVDRDQDFDRRPCKA
jgi:hypothetical protein